MKFCTKNIENWRFWKMTFFESAILDFFFQKKFLFCFFSNEEKLRFHMRYHFFRNFDDYPGFKPKITPQNISAGSVCRQRLIEFLPPNLKLNNLYYRWAGWLACPVGSGHSIIRARSCTFSQLSDIHCIVLTEKK